jgi:WD40 repeat protein
VIGLALVGFTQSVLSDPDIGEDIERARQIMSLLNAQGEFETTEDYHARLRQYNDLVPELREISEREYSIPLDVKVERYKPDERSFPVTVSRDGLLAPSRGFARIPASRARVTKGNLDRVWATVKLMPVPAATDVAQVITSVSVWVNDRAWPVDLPYAWTLGPRLIGKDKPAPTSVSPDGRTFAVGREDGTIAVAGLTASQSPSTSRVHDRRVNVLTFSPDSRRLVSSSYGTSVARVWSMDPLEEVARFDTEWAANCAAFGHRGRLLATGEDSGAIELWDLDKGVRLGAMRGDCDHVGIVRFGQNDDVLVCGAWTNGVVEVWDTVSRQKIHTFLDQDGRIHQLEITPDGQYVASIAADGSACVWELSSGRLIWRRTANVPGVDARYSLLATVHNPTRVALATAGGRSIVEIWDLDAGGPARVLSHGTAGLGGMEFTPDGVTLVTTRDAGTDQLLVHDLLSGSTWQTIQASRKPYHMAASEDLGVLVVSDNIVRQGYAFDLFYRVRVWDESPDVIPIRSGSSPRVFGTESGEHGQTD